MSFQQPNPAAIETRGIVKRYGDATVLDGIDLTVPAGGVLALLGPNGAGKTTMVRLLATLARPDAGTATVAGFDVVREPEEVRRRISLTGQYASVDELQTGRENLVMIGRLFHLSPSKARSRADVLLAQFDLEAAADRLVRTYSGGMRRRLDLASSLVNGPSVLFLDEPTTGLDPRSRLALWEIVRGLADSGVTILLTTQYLDEADRLASRIAVLDAGRIVAEGTADELKAAVAGRRLDLVLADAGAFHQATRLLGSRVLHADQTQHTIGIGTDGSAEHVHRLLDELLCGRIGVESLSLSAASLDDVFLALTGHLSTKEATNV